jgi:crotonobetainyl-CoA:carnitine CoA-transferase CaiB-like acyl-CoA transferase
LRGVRILDLTHVWAGPLAVRLLADLGADVVKVEAPYGRGPQQFPSEPIGGWLGGEPGDEPWNANAMFVKLHRNRSSLCVDLKQTRGRDLFLGLVGQADVVVENFSAFAMQKMGLGYDVLSQANPKIIYVAMPGYGASGPYSDRVAFGPVVEPMSGLTNMLGYSGEAPRNSAMALMDPIAATHAAASIVQALREVRATGQGVQVELSLHECGVTYSGPWLIDTQLGQSPSCLGNRHPQIAPHGVYPCAGDDQWLALACADDAQWQSLCSLVAELEPTFTLAERHKCADQIDLLISRWTAHQDKNAAAEVLQAAGIAAGPVNTVPDMLDDEQVKARGFFVSYERFGIPMPGNPIHMAGLDNSQWQPCPPLGAHNREVLADWLGYGEQQLGELENAGVLLHKPPD